MPRRRRLVSIEPVTSSRVSGSAFAAWTPERRRSARSAGTACTAARAAGISAAFRPPRPPAPPGHPPDLAADLHRVAPALEEAPGDLLRPAAAVEGREVEPGDAGVEGRLSARSPGASPTREPSEAQPKPRQEVSMPVVPSVTRRMPVSLACPKG